MLLVVDVQAGFVSDATQQAIPNIRRCVRAFDVVVATRFTADTPDRFERLVGWNGVASAELLPFVRKTATTVVEKETYAADSRSVLSLVDDEPVYIAGFETDACVLATAFALFDGGYRPIVIGDACATNGGSERHEGALQILRRNIGDEQVVTVEEVV